MSLRGLSGELPFRLPPLRRRNVPGLNPTGSRSGKKKPDQNNHFSIHSIVRQPRLTRHARFTLILVLGLPPGLRKGPVAVLAFELACDLRDRVFEIRPAREYSLEGYLGYTQNSGTDHGLVDPHGSGASGQTGSSRLRRTPDVSRQRWGKTGDGRGRSRRLRLRRHERPQVVSREEIRVQHHGSAVASQQIATGTFLQFLAPLG